MMRRQRPTPSGSISKPEDKAWADWFNKLKPEEHEDFLSKLGLDREDITEWEEKEGAKRDATVKRKE